jgi:hypothetical protein
MEDEQPDLIVANGTAGQVAEGAAPPSRSSHAIAELEAWFAKHCRNTPIAQKTSVYNTVFNAVVMATAAIRTIKE